MQVCPQSSADLVTAVLRRVSKEGTGVLPLNHSGIAAKTGSSMSGSWYMSFDDVYRVLTWTESDFQSGASRYYPAKGVSAKMLAARVWVLLKNPKLNFRELSGVFAGVESMNVRDLLWMEAEFQKP